MKARLISGSVSGGGEQYAIGAEATIGRSSESGIRLPSEGVSSRHARIYFDAERRRYFLEDLDSLNGTTLDGLPVKRPEPLDGLHVIEFAGGQPFIFQEVSRDPEEGTADTAAPEVGESEASTESAAKTAVDAEMPVLPTALTADEPPAGGVSGDGAASEDAEGTDAEESPKVSVAETAVDAEMPVLPTALADDDRAAEGESPADTAGGDNVPAPAVEDGSEAGPLYRLRFEGPGAGEPVVLLEGERVVGRSHSADIPVESRSVSRRHAALTLAGGRVTLRDLKSRNQTFVDGVRVTGEVELEPGARLRFGDFEATLIADAPAEGPEE